MGKVADRLQDSFELAVLYFVEQDGKQDGDGEAPEDVVEAHEEGVAHDFPEVGIDDEFCKVFHSYPRAVPDTPYDVVVFEGYDYSIHGGVVEDDIIDEGKEEDEVKIFASFDQFDRSFCVHQCVSVLCLFRKGQNQYWCIFPVKKFSVFRFLTQYS